MESPIKEKSVISEHSGSTREVISLAFPLMISFLSFSIMGVIDTLIMGHVGTQEQGGVGMSMNIAWTLSSLFMGTMSALTTFSAQSYGAGRYELIKRWVTIALMLAPLMSLFVWATIPFIPALTALFGTDEAIRPHVVAYLGILLWSEPFMLVSFALSCLFRGLGDMRTPMVVTILANIVNAALAILLVFGYGPIPALGVRGAALATSTATAFSCLAYLRLYFGKTLNSRFDTRRLDIPAWKDVAHYLKIGLPMGASWAVEMVSWSFMVIFISGTDPSGLAASVIVWQLIQFSFHPSVAMSIAASTLVGQYLGAERPDLARKAGKTTIFWSVIFMGSVGLFFALTREHLIALFNDDPQVILIGSGLMFLAACFQVFDALGISCGGVLRGAGDTRYPFFAQIVCAWLVFIPLIYLLGKYLGYGVYGAWSAALCFIIVLGIALFARYLNGKWTKMRVV